MNKNIYWVLVVLLLVSLPVQTLLSSRYQSIHGDEIYNIASGYSKLKTGDYRLNPEHGPLPPVISAFPLLFMNISFPFDDASWQIKNMDVLMPKFMFEYNHNPYEIMFWARLPMMLLGVILGIYVFKWARRLYGDSAGLLALFLYSFSPNILAHSQISSNDWALTVFAFIAVYYLWRFYNTLTLGSLMKAGITLGLALLCKFSALFLLPAYVLIVAVMWLYPLIKDKYRFGLIWYFILSLVLVFLIAYATLIVGYKGEGMFVPVSESLKNDIHLNQTLFPVQQMAESNPLLKLALSIPSPLPYYYARGFGFNLISSSSPAATTVVGDHLETRWYFFLLSFILKTPIAELILLLLALVFWKRLAEHPLDEIYLIIPFLVFHLLFCLTDKQFGYRYLIPTIPFLLVFVSRAAKLRNLIIIPLCMWFLISSVLIYPHYLSYTNEFVPPGSAHKVFVDSNIDWGQDLLTLRDYMSKNNITDFEFKYYGFPVTVRYYNLSYYGIDYKEPPCGEHNALIAISVTQLMSNQSCYGWLLARQPIARAGYSILIYNTTWH